jgi:polysaccharide export outer membrane protein
MSNIMQSRLSAFKGFFYPSCFILLALCAFSSCRVDKPTAYFRTLNKDTTIKKFVDSSLESKIVNNDALSISISSLNRNEDLFYNSIATSNSLTESSTGSKQGYAVDLDGNIQIHNLGKIHVVGLTRKQLKDSLEFKLQPYLKDPIVTVNFTNRRITILGEIGRPQVIEMQDEKIPLLDAIALSEDVSKYALKNDFLVIRDGPAGKIFKHVNLEDGSLFSKSSNWYYLQSGDIVYAEPNLKKQYHEAIAARNQQLVTVVLAAASLVLIALNIIHYNY